MACLKRLVEGHGDPNLCDVIVLDAHEPSSSWYLRNMKPN